MLIVIIIIFAKFNNLQNSQKEEIEDKNNLKDENNHGEQEGVNNEFNAQNNEQEELNQNPNSEVYGDEKLKYG